MRRHHPLIHVGGICALALTFFGCWWINSARRLTDAQTGVAERIERSALKAIHEEADKTRAWLGGQMKETRAEVLAEVRHQGDALQRNAGGQITALRGDVMGRVDTVERDANARTGEALAVVREFRITADLRLAAIQGQLQPAVISGSRLMDTYAALPGQLGAQVHPAWLALQPEITCRHEDGSGYGTCWHSRITGLMGEALVVGGVFTQHFPSLAASFDGIAGSVNKIGLKITTPQTKKQQVWEGFKAMTIIGMRFL